LNRFYEAKKNEGKPEKVSESSLLW